MHTAANLNAELINKYGLTGPRYTSYPTTLSFHEGFDETALRANIQLSNEEFIPRPLSLYVHLPFCQTLCYYCGCNKKVTRHRSHGERYLESLFLEIDQRGMLFDKDRKVQQLHFGGGTPTFFDDRQLADLMSRLSSAFSFDSSPQREFSIEIDPRTVSAERIRHLAKLGFNRLSLSVQDLNPKVQKAVNRVQDKAQTLALIESAREHDFESVSVDLIYGLPFQTTATFIDTLEAVIAARPDRLSVYNYAHMPDLFRAQRLIREQDLPHAAGRLALLNTAIDRLTAAGYVYIGMDHFALPDDELSQARLNGSLQRNFQGYSTFADCDLIGLGVSAISKVGASYSQNLKGLDQWRTALNSAQSPLWRGVQLDFEDRVRRAVIESLMCYGALDFAAIERRFNIDFDDYFALELHQLLKLQEDGLIVLGERKLETTANGMLLLRAVAMVFDESLQKADTTPAFSKVI